MHGSDANSSGSGARVAYTIAEAARLLSISYSKVEKLIAADADGNVELESFKIGKSRRITGAAIEDFVRRQQQAA